MVKSAEETDKGRVEEEQAVQMLTLECAVYLCLPLPLHMENGSSSMWGVDCNYGGHECRYVLGLNSQPTPTMSGSRAGLLDGA